MDESLDMYKPDINKLIYLTNVNKMIYKKKESVININKNLIHFVDYIFFQLTTYAISLLNNKLYILDATVGVSFMCRCIIESLALLKMYEEKHITKDDLMLLDRYSFLVEGEIYNKYKKLDQTLFILSDINETYEEAKKIYEKYNRKINFFKKVYWLKNFDKYKTLVEMYYPEELESYKILSLLTHPNDNQYSEIFNKCTNIDKYIDLVVDACNRYFPENKVEYTMQPKDFINRITSDKFTSICFNSREIIAVLEMISCDLKNIFGENIQSSIYSNIAKLLNECYVDIASGFNISVTCKIKPLIETISLLFHLLQVSDGGLTHKLNWDHSKYHIDKIIGSKSFDIDKSYETYIGKISKTEYKKFLNEKFGIYNIKSINKLVHNCIEEVIPKIYNDKLLIDVMKLGYEELQFLSHANCYMLQSALNVNEHGDTNLIYCINILIYCMYLHLDHCKKYMINEGSIDCSELINKFERNIKTFVEIINKMSEITKK